MKKTMFAAAAALMIPAAAFSATYALRDATLVRAQKGTATQSAMMMPLRQQR